MGVAAYAISLLSGLLFLTAAAGKLLRFERWERLVLRLFTRPSLTWGFGLGLPLAETTVAVLAFLVPVAGLAAAAALFLCLAGGLVALLPKHGGTECSCFGSLFASKISLALVLRNVGFALVSGSGLALALVEAPFEPPLWVSALAFVGAAALLALALSRQPAGEPE